jgi:hypothetical protein
MIAYSWLPLSAKPLAGIAFTDYNTARGEVLAAITEKHLIKILNDTGKFSTINEGIINRELKKFICIDEKCILNFADSAGIHLLIKGSITDYGEYVSLTLKAYSPAPPFYKKLISSYKVKIDTAPSINATQYSLILEEHSGRFLSQSLKKYIYPIPLTSDGNTIKAETELKIQGKYSIYREESGFIKDRGVRVNFTENSAQLSDVEINSNDNIFYDFKDTSDYLYKYYVEGKRSLVFEKPSFYDTLFIMFFTIPGSATMPFSAPVLGYFNNDDWQGLGLWAVNGSPYLYAEARGFINSPSRLKKENKNISKDDRALNYFAWYMLLSGGTPLFIDSFASKYIYDASNFHPRQELMGSNWTAIYLSAVSNGGGMFYKGHRSMGYFYFHLNNILLYATLREFSRPEKRDPDTGAYSKGKNNKKKGAIFASALALSKTVEIVHTIFTTENIKNGRIEDEYIIPEVYMTLDSENSPVYNLGFTLKY